MAGINFNINEVDEYNLTEIKKIAIKNGLPKTKPDLFRLAAMIAYNVIISSDEDTFKELTQLNK